jgi:wyosine [tRNA(Phe)-imidazoG37] synthetase (radical SAM superfamily)
MIVFGPVLSRRLGSSLGIDLTPEKICNLDCIYCECGKTKIHKNEKFSSYTTANIINEIDIALKANPNVDYITFSGRGEPCLYKDIYNLIKEIKEKFNNYKIAMITNTMMFSDEKVFNALLMTDLILPSVDAALEKEFKLINRPCNEVDLFKELEAFRSFTKIYTGKIWLEIFICKGINDTEENLKALSSYIESIKIDKIQINTLDRPGTEDYCKPIDSNDLEDILKFFKGKNVEIISRKLIDKKHENNLDIVLETLKRRPLTFQDIATQSGVSSEKIKLWIEKQLKDNIIEKNIVNETIFYKIRRA